MTANRSPEAKNTGLENTSVGGQRRCRKVCGRERFKGEHDAVGYLGGDTVEVDCKLAEPFDRKQHLCENTRQSRRDHLREIRFRSATYHRPADRQVDQELA